MWKIHENPRFVDRFLKVFYGLSTSFCMFTPECPYFSPLRTQGSPAFPQGGRKKALRKNVAVKMGLNMGDLALSYGHFDTFQWGKLMGTLYKLMICYTIRYMYIYNVFLSLYIIYILYLYSEHLHQTIGKMRFQSLGILRDQHHGAIPKNWHPRAPGRTFEPFWNLPSIEKPWNNMLKAAIGAGVPCPIWLEHRRFTISVRILIISIGLDFAPGFLWRNRQLEWYIRDRHLFSSFGGSWCSTATLIFRVVDCTRYNFSISTDLGKS